MIVFSFFFSHLTALFLSLLCPPPKKKKKKQLAWAVDLESRPVALHFLPELNACFAATVAGRLALVGSPDGDVEEMDMDGWAEMDLDPSEEPEGWSGSGDDDLDDDDDDEEFDDDDDDWDDDDDDDDDDLDDDEDHDDD